ncbi:MAG: ATP-binding cassette domain-containing protein [Sphaerochaetaceae bacterium]|nr:ATP-binding cassette domain-containing protein [Spirochaetales bacterium]MDY5499519.1 ATP-binding cassette domain-containing protein [Sphaerochaetaceae bacterium]
MADLLEVRDLGYSYQSYTGKPSRQVLDHLDLSVPMGRKVLVLGPFDAGKTTLARILSGLTPKYLGGPITGTLTLDGKNLLECEPWDLVEEVGYVSQNPQEQFIASTVEDELAFPLESLGVGRPEMRQRVDQALKRWGLEKYRRVSESQLSGGERKRVLVALEEMLDPKLWILDESFDDLDRDWRDQLSGSIRKSKHAVLVLASRYLSQFPGLFDDIYLLKDGRLVPAGEDPEASFSALCGDDGLVPLHPVRSEGGTHVLEARDIRIAHQRISDEDHRIFHLEVPEFRLESGQIITLVGENGSGKSTFARVACGLDSFEKGTMMIDGRSLTRDELNCAVGYLFQNPDLQIFLPTVRDELSWSLERDASMDRRGISERVAQACSLFGLDPDDTPTTMSYPQRKALQGAVYYLLDRPFYVLDELDNALTYRKAQEITRLLAGKGSGILVITHDPQFARLVGTDGFRIDGQRMVRA